MSGLFFALLAVLLAGVGARDQMLVASLACRQGKRPAALLVALGSAAVTSGIAAYASLALAQQMTGRARLLLAAIALALAGMEMLMARRWRPAKEPTSSLGAFGIVIFAQQLTDAARFLIFAIALASHAPIAAGLGGAAGSMAVVTAGWLGGDDLTSRDLARWRRLLGAALLPLASWLALRAMGRA